MSTRNIVPRANNQGSLGLNSRRWSEGHFNTHLKLSGYQGAVEYLNIPSIFTSFSLARDGGNNVTSVTYYGPTSNVIGTATITYDQNSNPTSVTDGTKTITFSYDGNGNLTGGTVA